MGLSNTQKEQLTNLFVNAPAPGQYLAHCCMKADDVYNIFSYVTVNFQFSMYAP